MRGYYPGEREYRERPQPRIRRPRLPERPARPPEPQARPSEVPQPAAVPTAEAAGVEVAPVAARRRGASRRIDWVLGILLGLVLGVLVVVSFLLFGSEGTIDAPSIHGVKTGKPAQHSQAVPGAPAPAANE